MGPEQVQESQENARGLLSFFGSLYNALRSNDSRTSSLTRHDGETPREPGKPQQHDDRGPQRKMSAVQILGKCVKIGTRIIQTKTSAPLPTQHFNAYERLPDAIENLERVAQTVLNSQKDLSSFQAQEMKRLVQAVSDRTDLLDDLKFTDDSMRKLMTAINESNEPTNHSQDPEGSLGAIIGTLLEDHVRLMKRLSVIYQHDVHLIEMNGIFRHKAKHFAELSTKLISAIKEALNIEPDTASTPQQSKPAKPPSETPSLLSRYMDRKGDIPIHRERIQQMILEHEQELQEREIRRDRFEELAITDEDFEQEYLVAKSQAFGDLNSAIADTEALELLCKRNGLNTSYARQPSEDGSSDNEGERPQATGEWVFVPRFTQERRDSHILNWVQPPPDPAEGVDPTNPGSDRPQCTTSRGWEPPAPPSYVLGAA